MPLNANYIDLDKMINKKTNEPCPEENKCFISNLTKACHHPKKYIFLSSLYSVVPKFEGAFCSYERITNFYIYIYIQTQNDGFTIHSMKMATHCKAKSIFRTSNFGLNWQNLNSEIDPCHAMMQIYY